jgi:hypothetical protein
MIVESQSKARSRQRLLSSVSFGDFDRWEQGDQ